MVLGFVGGLSSTLIFSGGGFGVDDALYLFACGCCCYSSDKIVVNLWVRVGNSMLA